MFLTTDRLTIRRITADDWQSLQAIWKNFNQSEYSKYDTPHETDDMTVRARLALWASVNRGTKHMFFAVCLQNTVIGYIAFNARKASHEIGYCFHADYHGKGYAKESLLALINALSEYGITRFTAGTAIKNTPSVALLKSCGFTLTGYEKVSFYKDENGNPIVFDGGVFVLDKSLQTKE